MNDHPAPLTSPQVWRFADYLGRAITVTAEFNESTLALTKVTVVRDEGCLYTKLLWDLGPDGTPDSSARQFTVPFGTTVLSKGQWRSLGLQTITDVYGIQFTAGF